MTTPRTFPADEDARAHVANALQLVVIMRDDLVALEARLVAAARLLTPSSAADQPPERD